MGESLQLATTSERRSKPSELPSKSQLIREWLAKLAMNAGQALDATALAVYQAIWEEGFEDLDYRVLEVAFRKTLRECKFWPVKVADVRAHIDQANANGLQLEAEEAWRAWVRHVDRHYHPDLGWDSRTPQLPAIIEHAALAAGGAFWVSICPESDTQWARKRFIESFTLAHETGQVQNLLTRGEAQKILASLASEAPARQLPQPAHAPVATGPEPSKPDHESLRALDDVCFEKISAPKATVDIESRRAELERQKRLILEKYQLTGRGANP